MIEKLEGIVVSETPYGDNSKIVNVFTREHGIVGVMCHGVKSMKSPLRTKTIKFSYGYFHINYKVIMSHQIQLKCLFSQRALNIYNRVSRSYFFMLIIFNNLSRNFF